MGEEDHPRPHQIRWDLDGKMLDKLGPDGYSWIKGLQPAIRTWLYRRVYRHILILIRDTSGEDKREI